MNMGLDPTLTLYVYGNNKGTPGQSTAALQSTFTFPKAASVVHLEQMEEELGAQHVQG